MLSTSLLAAIEHGATMPAGQVRAYLTLRPRTMQKAQPLSWSRIDVADRIIVTASWRVGRHIETADVEIDPVTFEVCNVWGPQPDAITALELAADVQRRIEQGAAGRYEDALMGVA